MFQDRRDAGTRLAERLSRYKDAGDAIVLGLPRGGVVTAFEVSKALGLPLDVIIVRKIGFPGQPELAIGAVSETGQVVQNRFIIDAYGVSPKYIKDEIEKQREEIERRKKLYRQGREIADIRGKTVILVDDGVATGSTMKAAIEALGRDGAAKLVVALPVAPERTAHELESMAHEFICLLTPPDFMAVGGYYLDFTQVTDEEVVEILKEAEKTVRAHPR